MSDMTPTLTPPQNLVETAAEHGSFKTFGRAVENAGLGDSLRAIGPFTVFAPTDAAFGKLPVDQLETLFKPENKAELASLVNYHVINGRKLVGDMKSWVTTRTIHGQSVPIKVTKSDVCFDGALITSADIGSSNGVIHSIDTVKFPTKQ